MVLISLFTAVLCAVSPFSIAIGPVPLSLTTLVIYLASGTLDVKSGIISVFLYILLGAVGLPVFSGFGGGFHKVAGVTGGFIIGYVPLAACVGLFFKVFEKKRLYYLFGMVIGTILLYTCGVMWFMFQTKTSLAAAFLMCVTPFLIGDAAKIIVALIVAPKLRAAVANHKSQVTNHK